MSLSEPIPPFPYSLCPDWANPVGGGGDPVHQLTPYFWVLTEVIDPIAADAIVSQDWEDAKSLLDRAPIPPAEATMIWNLRWRQVVAAVWRTVAADAERRAQRHIGFR